MKFAIWPSELDKRLSRKYGRAISRNTAIDKPTFSEIEDAVIILGMNLLEKDPNKLNPRLSGLDEELRTRGFLRVESPYGKGQTLKMIAEKIRELRSRSKSAKSKRKRR